jgi:hypothetical protein
MIEIYALCDPDSGEVRYVGKAKNAKARHKRHLSERHLGRPVNNWVKSLLAAGKIPEVRILSAQRLNRPYWIDPARRIRGFNSAWNS